jgi:hypothetical protein
VAAIWPPGQHIESLAIALQRLAQAAGALPMIWIKSPGTVQQRQSLFISKISSSASITSWLSMPTSPNSFAITATLSPCSWVRIRFSRVVLPARGSR